MTDEKRTDAQASAAEDSEDVKQALRKLAEKKPDDLVQIMAMEMSSFGSPLQHQVTPEHVTQILALAEKHDARHFELSKHNQENSFSERKSIRAYSFGAFSITSLIAVLVLFLYRDQPTILVPILTGLGGLISGFVGGWGFGRQREKP